MSDHKNPGISNKDLLKRVAELTELEERVHGGELTEMGERIASTRFWAKMRPIIAVNELSTGVEFLDGVAQAVINGDMDEAADAFEGVVSLLPAPSRQRATGLAPEHPMFTDYSKRSASPDKKLPARRVKRQKQSPPPPERPSETPVASTPASATKQTTSPVKVLDLTGDRPVKSFVDFQYSPKAPPSVRFDLVKLYESARGRGTTPESQAYPWGGQHLWYDPEEFPLVHVAHWRFFMVARVIAWEWGLHASSI